VAGERILLVEGKDDEVVVCNLCQHRNVPEVFKIKQKNGVQALLESIPVEMKGSNVERLAVVLDADEDMTSRWRQLTALSQREFGVSLPKEPDGAGTLTRIPNGPLFGVWLMPDNCLPGMLEDFLAFLIPNGDGLLPRVDRFLQDIPPTMRRFRDSRRSKARIHCWLAVQEEPGRPFGTAITARYLDVDCKTAEPFLQWLRRALVD
jgi:hypothetical protein